jgi:hypothetical protein
MAEDATDGLLIGLPREVEGDRRPHAVLSHRSSAATVRISETWTAMRDRPRTRSTARSLGGVAAVEVLALELGARARRVVHPEVRQPLVPRPGHAELLRTGIGWQAADGMDRYRGPRRSEDRRLGREGRTVDHPALEPHLLEDRAPPLREKADAVGARRDLVEVLGGRAERQVLVQVLPHAIRRSMARVRR